MPLITVQQIADMTDETWSTKQTARATMLLEGVMGWIARKAPCLTDPNSPTEPVANEARDLVATAILRAMAAGVGNVASEGVGPNSVGYFDRAALPTLTRGEKDQLVDLCPAVKKRSRYGTIRTRPGY